MDKEFKLPDPGEGIHEAEVVEILVSEGDTVEEGQSVILMETDKATNEVPSPVSGTVKEIRVSEGDMVRVGDVIMVFSVKDEAAEEAEETPEPSEEEAEPAREETAEKAPEEKTEAEPKKKEAKKKEAEPKPEKKREGPVPASPATRRLARELEVDLESVEPSGPHGRVTAEDVRAAAEGKPPEKPEKKEKAAERPQKPPEKPMAAPSLPDFSRWGPVEKKPLRSVRRTIARRMAISWSQIPHVTHEDEADVTELEAFRKKHTEAVREKGGALTLTMFLLKAAVTALKEFPRFNASLDMDAEEIIYKQYYHIGVAVDTENGLLVPVIRDVDCKSVTELAVELYDLAERTRNGEADREEMSGGTFTITNVGPLGGTGFTPIINYPQSAILGVARAEYRPVVDGTPERYRIVPRLILPLALGFDHRIVDGADAARFLNRIIELLQDPEKLMMRM